MIHVTPQRADSATFESYDTRSKAEVADAFLSFLWVAACSFPTPKSEVQAKLANAFAAASGQRYLSALNFVWQAAR
ncbi:hypothetical protein ACYZTL_22460 [Pseudomonas sp. LB3P81]